jgi:hypothetical protein
VLDNIGGLAALLILLEVGWWIGVVLVVRSIHALRKDIQKIPIEFL